MEFRRSQILINERFQLRYCLFVCSWLFGLSLMYPLLIYSLFDYFIHFLGTGRSTDVATEMENVRSKVVWLLALLQLGFIGVTFLISLFISHRIAGPLHKLRAFMDKGSRGEFKEDLKFRKFDHFPELADAYNHLIHNVRIKNDRHIETISGAIARTEGVLDRLETDKKMQLQEVIADLKRLRGELSI